MVTRTTKVIAAGLVLALGTGLAWPFRRPEGVAPPKPPTAAAPVPPSPQSTAAPVSPPASVAASFAADSTPTPSRRSVEPPVTPMAPPEAPAVMIAPRQPEPKAEPAAVPPAAAIVLDGPPADRIHIVHDGDTLERLAKRYLGDESRALEIFDLNRGTLENPHWLPIGAELRLPPRVRDEDLSG